MKINHSLCPYPKNTHTSLTPKGLSGSLTLKSVFKSAILKLNQFRPPGNIWPCLEVFLIAPAGNSATSILWIRMQNIPQCKRQAPVHTIELTGPKCQQRETMIFKKPKYYNIEAFSPKVCSSPNFHWRHNKK